MDIINILLFQCDFKRQNLTFKVVTTTKGLDDINDHVFFTDFAAAENTRRNKEDREGDDEVKAGYPAE